ncbi:helix-turn-helix transcriptional regulator [Lentibacter algarum]|uniref:helix-turn-helix domain-containing protein n=1 Tax=Lentibacter algarum TaxID=576131 RepID=UPI001C06514B|nr:helix-turn-helix transcriptional regulator [Lentibacter algarum]MBU2980852.1 helix-turn-helix transcriptional regulator [Lentibacter algarum]
MIPDKITHLCKLKNVTLRAACQAAGLKYSTLHAQIAHNRPIPFSTIDKLSRALNIPLSFFSDQQPVFQFAPNTAGPAPDQMMLTLERSFNEQSKALINQGINISIDDVLDWLVHVDFRLTEFDWLKDRVDIYHPLEEGDIMAQPFAVGKQSLAAQLLGFSRETDLKDYYERFDPDNVAQIRLSHKAIEPQKYTVTDQPFVAQKNGAEIRGSYRKLMAGVRDTKGSPFTLVFCRLIRIINE